MVLRSLFHGRESGTYVDIGAHHPVFYSNTYHFYLRGWRGINVDAIPGSMALFDILRPQDKNVEACLGIKSGEDVTFFEFEKPALSTLDKELAQKSKNSGEKVVKEHRLVTTSVQELLMGYTEIDFLNVDIEGIDELVLLNFEFSRIKPKVIAFEDHKFSIDLKNENQVVLHLEKNGYKLVALTGPTIIMSCI